MPRFSPVRATMVALVLPCLAVAQQPPRAVVEAIAVAKLRLAEGRASDAVQVLEKQLAFADGDKEFRDTLRAAYAAELKQLTDPKAIEATRKNLALLGGAPSAAELPVPALPVGDSPALVEQPLPPPLPKTGALPPPGGAEAPPLFPADNPLPPPVAPKPAPEAGGIDLLKQATAVFNLARADAGKYAEANTLFSLAFNKRLTMSADQKTAWAYCRLKVATDTLNRGPDAQTAADVVSEIEDALAIAPDHAGLQAAGRDILSAAKKRAGGLAAKRPAPAPVAVEGDWELLETDNFRVKYRGKPGLADGVARTAEEKRGAIFAKWSSAPGRKWQPKCEIVIHPDAESFARATRLPDGSTGRADVILTAGEVQSRRIDLRADDPTATEDALPRELTHVILADLFPSTAPPKWAALGMAVLSESPEQLSRYRRTVARCDRDGELQPLGKLLAATEVPAKAVTGFAVESVSLVDFLVRWKGEKHFITFLRDAQRYGFESGLKRQYQVADSRELEPLWRKNVLGK